MRTLTALLLLLSSQNFYSQEDYGLLNPANLNLKCANCIEVLNKMPSEVIFGLKINPDNQHINFIMTDVNWFNKLFIKNGDGIAVDMLLKSDYQCEKPTRSTKDAVARGKLLAPIYLKEMKEKMELTADGTVWIDLGPIPKKYRDVEFEMNLLLLNKKSVCHYTYFYNIKRYKWDLLEMGMFTDTLLSQENRKDLSSNQTNIQSSIQYRKLNFIIPFEKNKTNYTPEDMQALYDSLSLNLYDIKKIKIRAYASVEGSKANNIRLQESRAKSIVDALQSFQNDEIIYDISSAENWLEFYDDILETEYKDLSALSKVEIKKKLSNPDFNKEMEPILGPHRKAVVEIQIEKKTTFKNLSEDQLISEFNKSIANKDEATARELMDLAFQRMNEEKAASNLLSKLEIPKQSNYGALLNRKTVFDYYLNEGDLLLTYSNFKELKKLQPQSKAVNYNLVALKFKIWISGAEEVNPVSFKNEIRGLARYDVSEKLISRMLINYNIILTEINMFKRDYKAKDRNLRAISTRYKGINPTPQDLLKLAQYFVAYGKYDWATRLLKPHIGKVDTDEDLLFYYINLTVADPEALESASYKKILLNAIDVNEDRFCSLFNSALKDGISFQLLDLPLLKDNYCESCN